MLENPLRVIHNTFVSTNQKQKTIDKRHSENSYWTSHHFDDGLQ